ncbi:MAG: hypothetical protein KatS3mg054_0080 [Chloroflexus sp.]|nr:MAG: hypothetical protein KatS3mg054_0080 [Chloroflexus sp.]
MEKEAIVRPRISAEYVGFDPVQKLWIAVFMQAMDDYHMGILREKELLEWVEDDSGTFMLCADAIGVDPDVLRSMVRRVARKGPRLRGNPHCKPVISDRGEFFPSVTAAAAVLGFNSASLTQAIKSGYRIGGRYWKYVDANYPRLSAESALARG